MSKTLFHPIILALVLCLFMPVMAIGAEKSPLRQYVESIGYKKELMRATTAYALKERSCPLANPQLVRLRYHVLAQPKFEKDKKNPVDGAWFEEVRVIICHGSQAYDVTVIANKDGEMPEFSVVPSKVKSKP